MHASSQDAAQAAFDVLLEAVICHAQQNDAQGFSLFRRDPSRCRQFIEILKAMLDGFINARIIDVAGNSLDRVTRA